MLSLLFSSVLILALASELVAGALPQEVKDAIIKAHNECRAGAGLGEVTWDDKLEAFGAQIAQRNTGDCGLTHSSNDERKNIEGWEGKACGENLAYGMNSEWDKTNTEHLVTMAKQGVDGWCSEKQWYDIDSNSCSAPPKEACGHYTQVVWDESVTIGCGLEFCPTESPSYILACIYHKVGNVNNGKPYGRTDSGSNGGDGGDGGDGNSESGNGGESGGKECVESSSTEQDGDDTVVTTVTCKDSCTETTITRTSSDGSSSSSSSTTC